MAIYYVIEGILTKPTTDTLVFEQADPDLARQYDQALANYYLKYEQISITTDRKTLVYRIYYTDYSQRQDYLNVLKTQKERFIYNNSVGITITPTEIGYIDVPDLFGNVSE